ncbi:MAG: Gfo/Idh/MocA family oxidoreductase [Planctomycetes bacterium]|nr:Gfo/Idh/MocA family oxidoreductase [Planctomycetota bacterium]
MNSNLDNSNAGNRNKKETTRRTFLKSVGVAGAALAAGGTGCISPGRRPIAGPVAAPLGDKLRVAYIGVGGIGNYHIEKTVELGVECLCYCDVDSKRIKAAAEAFPGARFYDDYRKMFDAQHADIDAVMVGVPDHHHFPATMIAMQLGKHVYTQKPLTHTVWEARKLTEAARKYNVVTQMGNQGHALEGWRLIYEWVHSGAIGRVREVHTWSDRPIWPQGMERPEESSTPPDHLNWDVWLGPAPERPYAEKAYHPFNWRAWWDFGCGALGDMACHTMDCVFAVLDPGSPTAVELVAMSRPYGETCPTSSIIKWEYPRRGFRPGFTSYWYDGGLRPRRPRDLEVGRKLPSAGTLFIGTQASILASGDYAESARIIPEAKMKEIGKPARMLDRSPGHMDEWVMACKGEKPMDFARSNFDYAGPFTEAVLLGNVALRTGRRLEWDAENMTVTNLPEANQYINKEYRDGWRIT